MSTRRVGFLSSSCLFESNTLFSLQEDKSKHCTEETSTTLHIIKDDPGPKKSTQNCELTFLYEQLTLVFTAAVIFLSTLIP